MARLGPLACTAIAAASCGWARAADLPPAPSLPPASAAEEEFSGWYLRGDVGGGVNAAAPKLEITPGPLAGPIATQAVFSPSLSPFGMVDVGAGYQATSWFRADATIEYRFGASLRSGATDAWAGSAQTGDAFRADVASFVGLVNGYVSSRRLVRVFAFPRRRSWLRRQPAVERQREPAPGGAEASPRARD